MADRKYSYQELTALYEQSKLVIRNMVLDLGIAEEGDDAFILACHACGLPFRSDIEMGMVQEHSKLVHGITDPELDLIWIGQGMPPRSRRG